MSTRNRFYSTFLSCRPCMAEHHQMVRSVQTGTISVKLSFTKPSSRCLLTSTVPKTSPSQSACPRSDLSSSTSPKRASLLRSWSSLRSSLKWQMSCYILTHLSSLCKPTCLRRSNVSPSRALWRPKFSSRRYHPLTAQSPCSTRWTSLNCQKSPLW